MKCPHCNTGVTLEEKGSVWLDKKQQGDNGYQVSCSHCPECQRLIVLYRTGKVVKGNYSGTLSEVTSEQIIFPLNASRPIDPEVLDPYRTDFLEACAVLQLSPKASAAISRRILQTILREELGIKRHTLIAEIDEFINRPGVPSYLTESVDAIRNIGNFAAHPLKDTSTGSIVEVEPGEAEWLLEVLDSLFDFVFVQPKRIQERKNKLNAKLKSMGKPQMR